MSESPFSPLNFPNGLYIGSIFFSSLIADKTDVEAGREFPHHPPLEARRNRKDAPANRMHFDVIDST